MMTFEEHGEALDRARQTFKPGSRWLKIVRGRRFILNIEPDGALVEWHEDNPEHTWTGTWAARAFHNTPWWEALLQLHIENYRTRVRLQDDGSFKGYEVSPDAWEAEDRRERETHPDVCFFAEPEVTMTRL